MAIVNWNLIDGDSGSFTRQGWSGTHTVVVSELNTGLSGYERIQEAYTALSLPIGTPHIVYTDSFLQAINYNVLSTDVIKFNCVYEPMLNVPIEISITGRGAGAQTNLDYDNNPIEVTYTYPSDYQLDPHKVGQTETVSQQVNKQIPAGTITIKKREVITGNDLTNLSQGYVGRVNSSGWNIRPSDPARSWICSSIDGAEVGWILDGSLYSVYDVTYVYEYQEQTWDTEVVFIDSNTGAAPPATTWDTNTNKKVQVYSEIDFSNLTIDV